jgi:hypothetical protein
MNNNRNNLMLNALSNKKEGAMKKSLSIGLMVLGLCLTLTALAYGEGSLGVNVTDPQYNADVSSAGAYKSQLHFSKDGTDVGGWLTSVAENNFWVSSGATYDSTLGGWIQKSADGKSIFAGSGAGGFRIYAQEGNPVGGIITNATTRLVVGYNGYVGIGNLTPSYPLQMASGARCTTGGVWTNASSREYKENIKELSSNDALLAFNKLTPVTYNYKVDSQDKHVGFIAEDVPDLVSTPDKKALSPMDIVAVLTKVVQEQQKTIAELNEKVSRLEQQGR